jgi:hypothetical protein
VTANPAGVIRAKAACCRSLAGRRRRNGREAGIISSFLLVWTIGNLSIPAKEEGKRL